MSIGKFLVVKLQNFKFQKETIRLFYRKSFRFALADLLLGLSSLFFNPYRICRKNGSVYGETPPSTMQRIAAFCQLTEEDFFIDLGSGRGKGVFWISEFVGCRAIGIEKIGLFVGIANTFTKLLNMNASFTKTDIGSADLTRATCIYLYSTCMDDTELLEIVEKIPHGAKVVTVSAPMPKDAGLKEIGSFPMAFPWGETEGYLHYKG